MTNSRSKGQAKLHEPIAFLRLENNMLFRHSLAEHFVFGFEKFVLFSKIFFNGAGKQERARAGKSHAWALQSGKKG